MLEHDAAQIRRVDEAVLHPRLQDTDARPELRLAQAALEIREIRLEQLIVLMAAVIALFYQFLFIDALISTELRLELCLELPVPHDLGQLGVGIEIEFLGPPARFLRIAARMIMRLQCLLEIPMQGEIVLCLLLMLLQRIHALGERLHRLDLIIELMRQALDRRLIRRRCLLLMRKRAGHELRHLVARDDAVSVEPIHRHALDEAVGLQLRDGGISPMPRRYIGKHRFACGCRR